MAGLPHLLMSRADAEALLKHQIHRGQAVSNHELSDEAVNAALGNADAWEEETKDLLLSMFDSPEFANEFLAAGMYPKKTNTLQEKLNYAGGRITYKNCALDEIIKRLPLYDENIEKEELDIWSLIHPAIAGISKSRFESKHYADAIETALKYINELVKGKVKKTTGKELDGAPLMQFAFSPNNPIIAFDDISTDTGKNIQQGYMQIFAGAMTGIRNPKAHGIVEIDEKRAIHFLFFVSLLMHKLDEAI
jgi:uncharacterized protein (TIGR02391 family)